MKRVLSFILVLAMTAVWFLVPARAVPTSGTCGENVTWSFDETSKRLTISGTGTMEVEDSSVWSDYGKKTTSVVIGEGVTALGYGAFSGWNKLHTVILPSSVKIIEGNAFSGCSKLTNISIENITQLGNGAFSWCNALKEVVIPKGITEIPRSAFSGCRQLEKVVFHEQITSIGDGAFRDCIKITDMTIPDGVTTVESYAFEGCSALENVNLSKGVTTLSRGVFSGCVNLKSICIPDGITTIEAYAFSDCETLKEVRLGAGVSQIDTSAFWGCSMLKAFTLSDENPYLSQDRGVLYTKDRKTLLLFPYGFTGAYTVLPETVTVGNHAAYETGITALTLPGNVKTVDEYAFAWCENLKTLRLGEGVERLEFRSFYCSGIQKATIPASVTKLEAFGGCIEMKQLVIYGDPPDFGQLAFPYVDFTVFYPEKTSKWFKAHDLYGGLPSWELQCTKHTYVDGACSRCGVSDPKATDLEGNVMVAGNDYAVTQVELYAEGGAEPLRTYHAPVGRYLFTEILPGSYTLRISAEGCAPREYALRAVSGTAIQDLSLQMLGDINGDGKINIADVSKAYGNTKGITALDDYAMSCADMDGNGKVNVADISILYAQVKNAA